MPPSTLAERHSNGCVRQSSLAQVDEALVEREGFGIADREPAEVSMARVQQKVVLSQHDRRRHSEADRLARFRPTAANVLKLRRSWQPAPLGRKILGPHLGDREVARDVHREANEVRRKPVPVEVYQLLEGSERPTL